METVFDALKAMGKATSVSPLWLSASSSACQRLVMMQAQLEGAQQYITEQCLK